MTPVPVEDKVTFETVTTLFPAVIIPVIVPPIVPAFPLVLKVNAVLANTLDATLFGSCACTVTLKVLPPEGDVGVIAVIANFEGGVTKVVKEPCEL